MDNSDIEIYFKSHPDATVKEYLDYAKAKDNENKKSESEREKNRIEWYKALKGRCFLITFNSCSHIVLKVTKYPSEGTENTYSCYNIHIKPNYITKEDIYIHPCWFNNPYEKHFYGQDEGSCIEISEERYNEIVEQCARIETTFQKKIKELVEEIVNSINIKDI